MLHGLTPMPARSIDVPMIVAGAAIQDDTASLRLVVRSVIANVLGVGRDHPDVEDCTHEALSRALAGKDRLRDGEPLRPWVIGIAKHVALDAKRAQRARREISASSLEGDNDESGAASLIDRFEDPAPGPEERAIGAETGRRLEEVMAKLSAEQRGAMMMFHVDGIGYQDIARRLGVPLGTVATWISRGRRAVADALNEGGGGEKAERRR